jgi:hypothetical protein
VRQARRRRACRAFGIPLIRCFVLCATVCRVARTWHQTFSVFVRISQAGGVLCSGAIRAATLRRCWAADWLHDAWQSPANWDPSGVFVFHTGPGELVRSESSCLEPEPVISMSRWLAPTYQACAAYYRPTECGLVESKFFIGFAGRPYVASRAVGLLLMTSV